MKTPFRILVVIICAFFMQLVSCSKKHDPKSTTDIQLDKLRANWKATHVTSDGVSQDGYANFVLSFTGSEGSKSFSYATGSRPFVSPWEATGAFSFDTSKPAEILHRDDDVEVNYTVTATTLTLQFNFSGPGYVSGRASSLTGKWIFEFQKQ
ncbi:MAG: hypothetical protein WDO14_19220 [Bacteroidota bacterium]